MSGRIIIQNEHEEIDAVRSARVKEDQAIVIDWDAIHSIVQRILKTMDKKVLQNTIDSRVEPGSSRSRKLPLFTYRLYRSPEADSDPVIAGVSFEQNGSMVHIKGDISEEESGKVYFETESESVPI